MFTAGCTITVWVECILRRIIHLTPAQKSAIRKSTNGPGFDHFRAKVRWCQEISGAVVLYNYGVGVQYLSSFSQSKSDGKLRVIQGGAQGADD
jgi:hypothetical protein